ncbi:MAG: type II secretion system F family protein [Pseudomonadales bacterium]|nr:type II secretion system F family protein [Pseudomonadales bacterium]
MELDNDSLKLVAALGFFLAMILIIVSMHRIKKEVPDDDREYMDPLPKLAMYVWPIVRIIAYHFGERLPLSMLEKYATLLKKSGLDYLFMPSQLFGLQVVTGTMMLGVAFFILDTLEMNDWFLYTVGFMLGWLMPLMSLHDRRKKREKLICKELPTYLDFLNMAVQAGMNMSGAIAQSVSKGPDGFLKNEFSRVQRDMKAGMPRADALKEMANRLELKEVSAFTISVAQSERSGASISKSLSAQAEQRRSERFQRAEKLAMEAPVKLIFPLVAFIFPMTFAILAFPIAMMVIYEM